MRAIALTLFVVLCTLSLTSNTLARQNVCEDDFGGDAGSLPGRAHYLGGGTGDIGGLSGRLDGAGASPGIEDDFQDLYLVYISDPSRFTARVQGVGFLPQIWLFQGLGHENCFQVEEGGLLATAGLPGSAGTLVMRSNEPMGSIVVFDPGYYYLAITGIADNGTMSVPHSLGGEIFAFTDESISGPDGPGGLAPLDNWVGDGGHGDYFAQIEGLVFPCFGDFNGDFFVDLNDLLLVLSNWSVPVETGDFGFNELISVLAGWGPCPAACCLCDGTCVELRPEACANAGGVSQAPGVFCSTDPCGQALGGCCMPNGTCEHLTALDCDVMAGENWAGPGVPCAPDDPCSGPTTGACCTGFGDTCQVTTPFECESMNQVFAGLGTDCVTGDACLGACCFNGICEDLDFLGCLSEGGRWLAPGVPCAAGPDPSFDPCDCTPTGACCVDSICAPIPQRFCEAFGGIYLGDNIACDIALCVGACCLSDGATCLPFDQLDCNNLGGQWAGAGTDCAADPCPTIVFGACCLVRIGDPCREFTAEQCATADGVYQGDGSTCVVDTCHGVCCSAGGVCTEINEAECVSVGSKYQGIGTTCVASSCEGACCMSDGTCTETLQTDCVAAGDSWAGYCTTCVMISCASLPTGGCCDPDGVCLEQVTQIDCEFQGGLYRGNGILCTPNPCVSACCLPDGSCTEQTERDCTLMSGSYRGGGTTCSQGLCVGACCLPDGSCLEGTSLTECEAMKMGKEFGVYGGVDSHCSFLFPCRLGACCLPDDSCSLMSAFGCLLAGGVWGGDSLTCSPDPCPLPIGACCRDNGVCSVVSQPHCDFLEGVYQGDGVPCDPNPCLGACCLPDMTCFEFEDDVTCNMFGGEFQGLGVSCADEPCAGACCLPGDTCFEGTLFACAFQGGIFGGPGSTCSFFDPCPLGACCLGDGTCIQASAFGCLLAPGVWAGEGVPCDPDPCPGLVTGACCNQDGTICAEVTLVQCEALGFTYQGDGVSCDPNPCP